MADLPKEVQVFIVQQLACYRTPPEIIENVKENFEDVTLIRQQIYYYQKLVRSEPTAVKTKELYELFKKTRDQYDRRIIHTPIANPIRRLEIAEHLIMRELKKADSVRSDDKILDLLTFVSKEVGGQFSNRRELTGANGKDLLPAQVAREVLREILADGIDQREAIDFVKERYQVSEAELISEADN